MALQRDVIGRDEIEKGIARKRGIDTSKDRNDSIQSHTPPDARRDVRIEIWNMVKAANGAWVTRTEICKALKLKKTPWLNGHIERLVNEGYLEPYRGKCPNGYPKYWYRLPGMGAAQ